jgi:CheY-like chemotaxis protein
MGIRRQPHVLIVEDDPRLRADARRIVEHAGYIALTAENGKQGVRQFFKFRFKIEAVLLDIDMPVMNGIEALRRIRTIDPAALVIMTSSYGQFLPIHFHDDLLDVAILPKPYRCDQLLAKLTSTTRILPQDLQMNCLYAH